MSHRTLFVACAVMAFAVTAPVSAQTPSADGFVDAVAQAAPGEDQYARWDEGLCPSVTGLSPAAAQGLIDHIAVRANEVGVRAGAPGCRSNAVIIFAADGNRVAREIVDTRRDLLGYYGSTEISTGGRAALEEFANTSRPVRWYHVSRTVTVDGRELEEGQVTASQGTMSDAASAVNNPSGAVGGGLSGVQVVRARGTNMRRETRQDLGFVLVIVETGAIADVPAQAIGDYLALAVLAPLKPNADARAYPSILNLFVPQADGSDYPTEWSAWDRGFVNGLYRADRDARNARAQRNQIAREIQTETGGS